MATKELLTITQYDDFRLALTVRQPSTTVGVPGTPIDLTGATATGAVFKGYKTKSKTFPFTFEFNPDRTTGEVTAILEAEETGRIPHGLYLCQIKIVKNRRVLMLIDRIVKVNPGIPNDVQLQP